MGKKLEIFNNINFTSVINQLQELKTHIPNVKHSLKDSQLFAINLQQIMLNAFNITNEMADLSQEELRRLDDYFYVNYLRIQCKKAAVRVSPKGWRTIEEQMLLLPTNQ